MSITGISYRSPFLDKGHCVEADAESPYAGLPLHFGDPSGEQWSLEAHQGIVDRSDLRAITLTGEDRLTLLTNVSSQQLRDITPGDPRELLICDANGRIQHVAAVSDDGETTCLVTEGRYVDELQSFLESMRFMLRVSVVSRPDIAVLGTVTKLDDASSSRMDTSFQDAPGWIFTWDDPWPGPVPGGALYFQGDHPGRFTVFHLHLVERVRLAEAIDSWLGRDDRRRPAGILAWEATRIAAWRPKFGQETDDRSIAPELDWLRTAVHIDKGCYPGQETIARVLNLGKPPRRLVFLHLDGSLATLPEPGAAIMNGSRQIGVVTSVARHAELGPIALALVNRQVPTQMVFNIDGVAASQEAIVPVEGRSSVSPKERPGALLSNPQLRRPDVPAAGSSAIGGKK